MSKEAAALAAAIDELITARIREMIGGTETEQQLVQKYGEVISRGEAAKLLGVNANTITAMCRDGRLRGTPLGVIVRSISAYLDDGRPSAQRVKKREAAAKAGFQLIEK